MVLSVQYLRGIAALMVLLEHVGLKSAQYSTNSLSGWHMGGAGVDLFFLISGFIMCHTGESKHQQRGAAGQFLWRRVLRIIPLYWLVTCAALVIFIIAPEKINSQGGETGILASYFLLPTDQLYLVSNGWTLRYEFLFYLIFMLGLFFSKNFGRLFVAGLIITMVSMGQWLAPSSAPGRFISDPLLLEFIGGMLLYVAYSHYQHLRPPRIILSAIFIGLALGGLLAVNQGIRSGIRIVDFGTPMIFLMAGALCLEPILKKRTIGFLKMLGDSSFAMYLVHPFVLAGGAMVLNKLNLNMMMGGTVFIAALLVLSILAGYLVYEIVEKNIGRYLSNIGSTSFGKKTVSST